MRKGVKTFTLVKFEKNKAKRRNASGGAFNEFVRIYQNNY